MLSFTIIITGLSKIGNEYTCVFVFMLCMCTSCIEGGSVLYLYCSCLIDGGFAHIKKLYRRSDVDLLQDVAHVVDNSAFSNVAVLKYKGDRSSEWDWRDWKTFLSQYFKRLPGISKYQHFRFSSEYPGYVFVKKGADDNEVKIDLLKKRSTALNITGLPTVLPDAGFSAERKKYLYRTLRQYVRPVNQENFCSSETVNEE